MLLSMTGFGSGRGSDPGLTVHVEIRSVNNRHFKLNVRGSEPYPQLESELEKLLKTKIKRGTLTLHVRVERAAKSNQGQINLGVLQSYLGQLAPIANTLPANLASGFYASLLNLSGVTEHTSPGISVSDEEWKVVTKAVHDALTQLIRAREVEGQAMEEELRSHMDQMEASLSSIQVELPNVMHDYRQRITTRIRQALAETKTTIDESQLIREIALFADRSDIGEELCRLNGHLAAVREAFNSNAESVGRRLEFLAQEMGREANTLGSKAGSAAISKLAIDMKTTLEKFRELVLNIE